ncbi:MAG: nucleotide exchange factor GrpE [Deltaproteobacteria bacterium]|jgi:molecular chaperone GrpE|nr:nucleotide exchange factor GrpE [Deltaproteobacteria bacterium]
MTETEKKDSTQLDEAEHIASSELLDCLNRLAQKEEELKASQEKTLRLAAEFENFKKRMEREKAEHIKYALESFVVELLPFLDNLERAIAAAKDTRDIDKLVEGLELSLSGYSRVLEAFGLKCLVAQGLPFDPSMHDAICTEHSDEHEEGAVVRELMKGYALNDKVIRPAKVTVCKKNC